jgi:quercetin dioxygenase-like cupin family protein
MSAFRDLAAIPPQVLRDGYAARVVHGELLTFAVVEIEPNADLPEHHHENEQLGMVLEGSVTFRIRDEERSLQPGEIWVIPANAPHSVTGGPEGAVVIDLFTPVRGEWRDLPGTTPKPPRWPS